jgi:acetylornithine deacetylase/succinyl-diaminopimelate desuccinylase-like protein
VVTQLNGGHAKNALPQRARANINCRILPDQSVDEIEAALRRGIGDDKVAITRLPSTHGAASAPSPLVPGLIRAIEATTQELWPGVPVIPTMSTGATDGMFLRNAGVPTYGVSGIFGDIDDVRAHGRDERLEAKSYYEGLEFLYRLTGRLARASDEELTGTPSAK